MSKVSIQISGNPQDIAELFELFEKKQVGRASAINRLLRLAKGSQPDLAGELIRAARSSGYLAE